MRKLLSTVLTAVLAVQVQTTATASICESYSYTGTITFVEYSTVYAGVDITESTTTSIRLSTFQLSSGSTTAPTTSISSTHTMRTGTDDVPGNGTIVVIPGSDTIAPVTQTATSSIPSPTSPTASSSSTLVSIAPDATSGQFYVIFNTPDTKWLRKRAIWYLAFDNNGESVLVMSENDATVFMLDNDGSLITAGDAQYIAIENSTPARFYLQPTEPDPLVLINVYNNGSVSIQGIEGYCALQDDGLAVSTDGQFPSDCQLVVPEIVAMTDSSGPTSTKTVQSPTSLSSMMTSTLLSSSMIATLASQSVVASSSMTNTATGPRSTGSSPVLTSTTTQNTLATSTMSTISSSKSSASLTSAMTSTSSSTRSSVSSVSFFSFPISASSSTKSATTSTESTPSIVTDQAYIDTVIRHHNYHRLNHTAPPLSWNDSLASSAKDTAESCIYAHNTSADGGGYGQNIGAGYLSVQMGLLISDGFYNGEVNSYTYYGQEPDLSTLHAWGHFSQIVWVGTAQVGCYTQNCTASGLGNVDPNTGIRPFFTVCNYGPPGNYVGRFAKNVLSPTGLATIHAGYQCPGDENCVNTV